MGIKGYINSQKNIPINVSYLSYFILLLCCKSYVVFTEHPTNKETALNNETGVIR